MKGKFPVNLKMSQKPRKPEAPLAVEAFRHDGAMHKNIPAAKYQSVLDEETKSPNDIRLAPINLGTAKT